MAFSGTHFTSVATDENAGTVARLGVIILQIQVLKQSHQFFHLKIFGFP